MLNKRIFLLMNLFLLLYVGLLGRIFYFQLVKGEDISRQAAAMRSQQVELREYNRGDILDRNLSPLTDIRTSSALYCFTDILNSDDKTRVNLEQTGDQSAHDQIFQDRARFLAQVLKDKNEAEILAKLRNAKGRRYIMIDNNLSDVEIAAINEAHKEGLVIVPLINRYREDGFFAHLLGYASSGPNGQGQSGLEKAYDNILQGNSSAPELVSVFDARGMPIQGLTAKLNNEPNQKGTLVLTIDKRFQEVVEKSLAQRMEKGAVVVMDIHSKEILAMTSRPTFDPNAVSDIITFDKRSTLTNRALSKFNPGSLFKILLCSAALEDGLVALDEQFNCTGKYSFNEQLAIACWKEGGHGNLNLSQAFANSCNPTFIKVGLRLGRTEILRFADRMHVTDENIIGYDPGKIGTYVKIAGGSPAIGNASLGQEGVMLSPVQIASLLATIADNGTWATPRLVKYTIDKEGRKQELADSDSQQVISRETAQKVRRLLEKVVQEGTGKAAAIDQVQVAGKTATSQTGQMKSGDEEILNTWFAGYLPADEPRWAIVVMVEEGSSGAETCAPIFKDICRGLLQY